MRPRTQLPQELNTSAPIRITPKQRVGFLLQNPNNLIRVLLEIPNQFVPQLRDLVSEILSGSGIGGGELVREQAQDCGGDRLCLGIEVAGGESVIWGLREGEDEGRGGKCFGLCGAEHLRLGSV